MTANIYQGHGNFMDVVGKKSTGHLPGPVRALRQGSEGETMSDLQFKLENERKQHEDSYRYMHGHNDHGLGQ